MASSAQKYQNILQKASFFVYKRIMYVLYKRTMNFMQPRLFTSPLSLLCDRIIRIAVFDVSSQMNKQLTLLQETPSKPFDRICSAKIDLIHCPFRGHVSKNGRVGHHMCGLGNLKRKYPSIAPEEQFPRLCVLFQQ